VLGWTLLALAVLDYTVFWLPNVLTLMLAFGGLAHRLFTETPLTLEDQLIGGVAGFGVLWLVAVTYRAVRGRHGIGGGDPKMLAALGIWFGWQVLPMVVLLACFYGLVGVASVWVTKRSVSGATKLPFGVLLALGAWTWWMVWPKPPPPGTKFTVAVQMPSYRVER